MMRWAWWEACGDLGWAANWAPTAQIASHTARTTTQSHADRTQISFSHTNLTRVDFAKAFGLKFPSLFMDRGDFSPKWVDFTKWLWSFLHNPFFSHQNNHHHKIYSQSILSQHEIDANTNLCIVSQHHRTQQAIAPKRTPLILIRWVVCSFGWVNCGLRCGSMHNLLTCVGNIIKSYRNLTQITLIYANIPPKCHFT